MGKLVVCGNFEWDEKKNEANILKHGISFDDILSMFDDPLFWEQYDSEHSTEEETRYLGFGKVKGFSVVVSCYTERKRTRIISARISSAEEERKYEKWCKQFYS